MKLEELLDLWLNRYEKVSLKTRSYNKYTYFIKLHINPKLGNYELSKLSSPMLQEFMIQKLNHGNLRNQQSLSVNTVLSMLSILKQALKLAFLLHLIPTNPAASIKLPIGREKEILALTREEQKNIEQYCLKSKKKNYLGILICLYTGIRLGELLALTWKDVDLEKKLLFIKKTTYTAKVNGKNKIVIDQPKTKKSIRIIPISDSLLQLLKAYKDKNKSIYIIHTYQNKIVETRAYQRTFQSILRKCHIKHYNFHCLRHTFVTRALELGVDVKTLSEILGHTNVTITLNRYAHSMMDYKMEQMNKIGMLL